MAITIYFIATSLPDRLASVRDALLLKHPSELTIEVLESALKDVESNLRSVASTSGAVPPPLFHGCTVPQLPTFTASLATATTDVTAAAVTTSSRSRGRGGKRGVRVQAAAAVEALPAEVAGVACRLVVAGVQGLERPLVQRPVTPLLQLVEATTGLVSHLLVCRPRWVEQRRGTWPSGSSSSSPSPCSSPRSSNGSSRFRGQHCVSLSELTDTVRLAYGVGGPAPDCASDSVYSSVVSLGACLAKLPLASVGTCADTSPGARSEDASLSFTLDSGASHCFFRDHTTLTPLPAPVSVALADPTSGPDTARYTTTLPCPAVPSGSLTGFHVPLFSRNLVGVRPLVSQHVGVWIEPSGETAV
ncbi:unnamed protein product, partial [Closterium sp. NIES-53]